MNNVNQPNDPNGDDGHTRREHEEPPIPTAENVDRFHSIENDLWFQGRLNALIGIAKLIGKANAEDDPTLKAMFDKARDVVILAIDLRTLEAAYYWQQHALLNTTGRESGDGEQGHRSGQE